jgi:hypothetical protein
VMWNFCKKIIIDLTMTVFKLVALAGALCAVQA